MVQIGYKRYGLYTLYFEWKVATGCISTTMVVYTVYIKYKWDCDDVWSHVSILTDVYNTVYNNFLGRACPVSQ